MIIRQSRPRVHGTYFPHRMLSTPATQQVYATFPATFDQNIMETQCQS